MLYSNRGITTASRLSVYPSFLSSVRDVAVDRLDFFSKMISPAWAVRSQQTLTSLTYSKGTPRNFGLNRGGVRKNVASAMSLKRGKTQDHVTI